MSTNAIIAYYDKDKQTYVSSYTHWDGYPSHHFPILTKHYDTLEKVKKLIALGSLSMLDNSCEKPDGHSFNFPVKGYCIAYGRDRGDGDVDPLESPNTDIFDQEYAYLFKDGQWYWQYVGYGNRVNNDKWTNSENYDD